MFPFGVDKADSFRVPWVSIALAGLCAGVFLAIQTDAALDESEVARARDEIAGFWRDNPTLALPDACLSFERLLTRPTARPGMSPTTAARPVVEEHFRVLCQDAAGAFTDVHTKAWGLIPTRGLDHPSVATHLFFHVHLGEVLALLGFLLLCLSLLETLWGHAPYLVFLLGLGVLGNIAQALLEPGATVPIVGLGGAVAAGMGAYALRMVVRRARFATWLGRWTTLTVPGWVAVLAWLAWEGASLWVVPGTSRVVLLAHGGAFAVGALLAGLFKLAGWEEAGVLAPVLPGDPNVRVRMDLEEGGKLAAAQKWVPARLAYRRVLESDPHNLEALWALPRISLAMGDRTSLQREVDRLLHELVARKDLVALRGAVGEYEAHVDFNTMRPGTQYGLARNIFDPNDLPRAVTLYEGAAKDAKLTVRAYLRCAEMYLADKKPDAAVAYAQKVLEQRGLSEEFARRGKELLQQGQDLLQSWSAMGIVDLAASGASPGQAAAPGAPTATRVTTCRFTGRTGDGGYQLQSMDGQTILLWAKELVGVGLAMVPLMLGPGGPQRVLLVVDLVLKDESAPTGRAVLRMRSDHMGLATLFPPGTPTNHAFGALMAQLISGGVPVWPGPEVLQSGRYPQFSDLRSFEMALHGQVLEGSTTHAVFPLESR